jgi:antitoxin CptB
VAVTDEAEVRRLRWRCRRGMRELDQLLEGWLDTAWAQATDTERRDFPRLLDCEDDRLWRWLMGAERAEDPGLDALVQRIRDTPRPR